MKPRPIIAPITAASLSPEWIALARETIQRNGQAVRAGAGCTIELQSINTGEWGAIAYPPNLATSFTTAAERDAVLAQLVRGTTAVWLWSQALADEHHHAIPAGDHDPRASGWVARCGAVCCSQPAASVPRENACPQCVQLLSRNAEVTNDHGANGFGGLKPLNLPTKDGQP